MSLGPPPGPTFVPPLAWLHTRLSPGRGRGGGTGPGLYGGLDWCSMQPGGILAKVPH
jgi:hypothetical protein